MNILKIDSLSKSFGGVSAVADFSMLQKEETITGIIGPNGAGKTTVFNLISGVYYPDKGAILFEDSDITNYSSHRRTMKGIARTFQNIRLFKDLTVMENLTVSYNLKVSYTIWEEMVRWTSVIAEEKKIKDRAKMFLSYFDLYKYAALYPSALPYGLQRRLELARALMIDPKLLLLDEPAAGLNPKEVYELIKTISKIQEEHRLSIIIVEHHMELVMNICRYIYVLDFGRKIAEGQPEKIKHDKKVLQAYLGDEV